MWHIKSLKLTWIAWSIISCLFGEWSNAKSPPPARISFETAGMNPALADHVTNAVTAALDKGDMAGCVVLVGRRAGVVFERAYGNRRVEPEVVPMTIDTVFDLASLTKPIATATCVMVLVDRGQMSLSDKVVDFFPEFAANGKGGVTVEHLLTHAGGLIPDNRLEDYDDGWQSAAGPLFKLELRSEPGTRFEYSDVGFLLLGKIVEKIAGRPLNEFAGDEIYSKLGMASTGFLPDADRRARAASTDKRNDAWLQGQVHDPRAAKLGGVAGHAGLFGTAEDLAVFASMLLQQGEYGGVRVLSPSAVAEMIRPRTIGGQLRGLGWDSQSGYSRNRGDGMSPQAFGHGGFTGTSVWIDPTRDLYVIFLSNRLHPDGRGEVNSLAGRIGTFACDAIRPRVPQK